MQQRIRQGRKTMHAVTLEILTRKGRFATDQAVAVAEAIDMAIRETQIVTVPILDARLSEFKHGFSELRGEFSELKGEVSVSRGDMATLKTDVSVLKGDVGT